MFDIPVAEVAIGILLLHLFFFIGFQYQLLNLLEEIAYPNDDPIMTSTLEFNYSSDAKSVAEAEIEEVVEEAEIEIEEAVEEWDGVEDLPVEEVSDSPPSQCSGTNKSGKQCGRGPKPDSAYCHLHQ